MNFHLFFLLEQVAWIPIGIAVYRFRDMMPKYLPLFIYLPVITLLELSGNLFVKFVKPMPSYGNAPFYNVMFLCEALLATWQFYKLNAFKQNKKLYIFVQVLWLALWFLDNFIISSITDFTLTFHTTYSFLLLFVITLYFGRLVVSIKHNIYRNPDFWIAIAFALWFVYSIFYALSNYLVVNNDQITLAEDTIKFREISEVLFYLIIAWAIICIPHRRIFKMQSSLL